MTCIAAVVHDGRVVVGGDSQVTCGGSRQTMSDPKVIRNGPYLIGGAGPGRFCSLIRSAFKPPALPALQVCLLGFMRTRFVDALRDCLKEGGFAERHDDQEWTNAAMIVGVRGRLFEISADYGVFEPDDGYTAIGSGTEFALGSLATSEEFSVDMERTDLLGSRERVRLALDAACRHSIGCGPPFVILMSEPIKPTVPSQRVKKRK